LHETRPNIDFCHQIGICYATYCGSARLHPRDVGFWANMHAELIAEAMRKRGLAAQAPTLKKYVLDTKDEISRKLKLRLEMLGTFLASCFELTTPSPLPRNHEDQLMASDRVMIWEFSAAPVELRDLYRGAEPRQWLALVPAAIHGADLDQAIAAQMRLVTVDRYETGAGDVVYIGSSGLSQVLEAVGSPKTRHKPAQDHV
jgi:hypothetical protein